MHEVCRCKFVLLFSYSCFLTRVKPMLYSDLVVQYMMHKNWENIFLHRTGFWFSPRYKGEDLGQGMRSKKPEPNRTEKNLGTRFSVCIPTSKSSIRRQFKHHEFSMKHDEIIILSNIFLRKERLILADKLQYLMHTVSLNAYKCYG